MIDTVALVDSLVKFVRVNFRYPSKKECSEIDYLFGYNTYLRKLGPQDDWKILEDIYEESPKTCGGCQLPLRFEKRQNKFCSQSCAASFNNSRRKLRAGEKCYCGEALKRGSSTYCSSACHKHSMFLTKLRDWEETGSNQTNSMIRKFLSTIRGYSCEICGISDWCDKPITLEVDHISGNNEDCSLENVRLLCLNCHSQTDTFRAKNKGFGRVGRMERYRQGKSY